MINAAYIGSISPIKQASKNLYHLFSSILSILSIYQLCSSYLAPSLSYVLPPILRSTTYPMRIARLQPSRFQYKPLIRGIVRLKQIKVQHPKPILRDTVQYNLQSCMPNFRSPIELKPDWASSSQPTTRIVISDLKAASPHSNLGIELAEPIMSIK